MKKILFVLIASTSILSLHASEGSKSTHCYKVVNGVKGNLEAAEKDTYDFVAYNVNYERAVNEEYIKDALREYPDFLCWRYSIDEETSGLSLLHLLVHNNIRPDLFELLLIRDADPSVTTEQGYTVYDFVEGKHRQDLALDERPVNDQFIALLQNYHDPSWQTDKEKASIRRARFRTFGTIALVAATIIGSKKLYDYWTCDTERKK